MLILYLGPNTQFHPYLFCYLLILLSAHFAICALSAHLCALSAHFYVLLTTYLLLLKLCFCYLLQLYKQIRVIWSFDTMAEGPVVIWTDASIWWKDLRSKLF